MPRTRSARVAVLGSVERRPASASTPSRSSAAVRRRVVIIGLVVLSLALVTIYFRESSNGALHTLQSTGASVLRPFEVAAERIARPFRDVAGWFDDVLGAKSENERLRAELERMTQQAIDNQSLAREAGALRRLIAFVDSPQFPKDYRAVATRVIARAPNQYVQQVVIAAGSRHGVRLHAPVVTGVTGYRGVRGGLVGQVTKVTRDAAQVTLLIDETSYVSAHDSRTGADGIVQHGQRRGSDSLEFARVTKDKIVTAGDAIVTSGWQSREFESIYPRGIPICIVSSASQSDIDLYKRIQCKPFVDFGSLDSLIVLVAKRPQPVIPK